MRTREPTCSDIKRGPGGGPSRGARFGGRLPAATPITFIGGVVAGRWSLLAR